MRLGSRLAVLVALATLSSGCSFLSVYGPSRSQKASIAVSCTDERYAPAIDVGLGGAALAYSAGGDLSTGARVGLAATALAWGGSAVYGFLVTDECRKAKDALSRYHTKLLLRQIDLLNEAASQDEDEATPPEPPSAPPPAPPVEDDLSRPAYVPPPG